MRATTDLSRLLACVPLLLLAGRAHAQFLPPSAPFLDWERRPVLAPERGIDLLASPSPSTAGRGPRVRLPGIQPGFLLEEGADEGPDDLPFDRMTVTYGEDNPWFDFRPRPPMGGLGYVRAQAQVPLLDLPGTACVLNLDALAPAGIEFDGLPANSGPRLLTPSLAIYQALDDETGLQGFVGRPLQVGTRASRLPGALPDLQCGLAVYRPLVPDAPDLLRQLYVSVGAFGQVRDRTAGRPLSWDMLPGFHWKLAEGWSLSGAVSVPFQPASRAEGNVWQVMCSWQY